MRRALLVTIGLVAIGLCGCHRRAPAPRSTVPAPSPAAPPARVLIVYEGESAPDDLGKAARALESLVAHFDEGCALMRASSYEGGRAGRYAYVFYLARPEGDKGRAGFAADLADYEGTAVWVGPGLGDIEASVLARLGVKPAPEGAQPGGPRSWSISYGGQRHAEHLAVPGVGLEAKATVVSRAEAGGEQRPFLVRGERLWYAAAAPAPGEDRFWSACVWADALHEILGRPHRREPRMLAILRDVPVWVSERQVPEAIGPVLEAGVPVSVLASCHTGEVLLSDRPAAVRGLRRAESLGATVTLASRSEAEAREQLYLAWELGLHPVAWAGPAGRGNPFRLRIAARDDSPPYAAGGLLPAPIAVTDAGRIAPEEARRLEMQLAVRDAVALVSFGLWAPPAPLLGFLREQKAAGWRSCDLRDLGVVVADPRRTVAAGDRRPRLPGDGRYQKTVLGPRWETVSVETIPVDDSGSEAQSLGTPARSVTMLEPVRSRPARPFISGVTLDPWAYAGQGISAETLAEALAERYSRNGVNTVFLYAYNVDEGAAYRTRHPGASVSEWGRQDLLGRILESCHARGIRVVAWLYSGRDRGSWSRHEDWRERTASGKEYNPLTLHATYFLCPRNPEVGRWFAGLLGDLARRYPTLDGIELCEPLVNWWGDQACHCEVCREGFAAAHPGAPVGGPAWREFRAEGLHEFLSQCLGAVSAEGIDTYLMTISDAWSNGAILSPRRQAEESGFDLERLLDGPHPPDWVNFELIWQQWAAIYGEEIFNPRWAAEVAEQLVRRVDGRARVVLHVELTDFGSQKMTGAKIAETIRRVSGADPAGVECYHSAAVDQKAAWSALKQAYERLP